MLMCAGADAQEPGWTGPVLARGPLREEIESTPIEYRAYRPFHFYGNTIRRRYYRGTAVPSPRDVLQGGSVLVRPSGYLGTQ
jgi:hypothetical protein